MRQFINIVENAHVGGSNILTRRCSHESYEGFIETQDRVVDMLIAGFEKGTRPRWKTVPAALLKTLWASTERYGFIQNTKGLESIAQLFFWNTAWLYVNTEIAGHTDDGGSVDTVLDRYYGGEVPEEWTAERKDAFTSFVIDYEDGWRISDYGLPRLVVLACLLKDCSSAEETFMVCDAMLNVAHQRSDLASWFVEGGSYTLSEVSA